MAVVVDATGTKLITAVAGASVNYTGITVGTGVNRALVVTVACAAAVTAPTATWDSGASNQAMSLISVVETQTNVTTFMFGLRNPVSGAKTLNVAWTTSAKSNVEAISFTGVEQASDARAFILANFAKDGATLNAITMGITPPRDSIVVASYATSATFSTLNQTNLFTDITNTGCEGGATRANGAGASISFTGTDTTTTGNKVMVGFAIISDSAPPTVPWPDPRWPPKAGLAAHLQSFIVAEPVGPPKEAIPKVYRWFQPLAEVPKRSAFAVWQQQSLAWSPLVATTVSTDVVASDDGSAGPRFRYRLIYRAKTEPVFVPVGSTDVVAGEIGSSGPTFQQQFQYSVATEPAFVPPTTVVTYTPTPQWPDRVAAKPSPLNYTPLALVVPTQPTVWSQSTTRWPELLPTRKRPVTEFGTFVAPPAQVNFSYPSWPDFAPSKKLPTADQQALAWSPFVAATPVITVIDWDFATPIWSKPRVTQQQTLAFYPLPIPPAVAPPADGWVLSFAEVPRRPAFAAWLQQTLAWSTFTPVPVVSTDVVASDNGSVGPSFRWRLIYRTKTEPVFVPVAPPSTDVVAGEAGSVGPEFQRQFQYAVKAEPVLVPAAAFTYSQLTSWPDAIPVRKRPVTDFRPWTFVPTPAQVFFPYAPWDDFTRRKKPPLDTQPLAWSTFTPGAAQVFFPYAPWDDFAKKPAFATWQQQALAWSTFTPAAVFFLPERWPDFATKKKPPLNYQPLVLVQTVRTPWVTMTTWPDFAHLKRKPALGAPYQQFTARFVGTVTATVVTVSMSAFEVNSDTANAVVRVIQSQPAASALVSIEETGILIDPLPGGP